MQSFKENAQLSHKQQLLINKVEKIWVSNQRKIKLTNEFIRFIKFYETSSNFFYSLLTPLVSRLMLIGVIANNPIQRLNSLLVEILLKIIIL